METCQQQPIAAPRLHDIGLFSMRQRAQAQGIDFHPPQTLAGRHDAEDDLESSAARRDPGCLGEQLL